MAYQPGIPTGSVPLNQDYLNVQGNFTSLNSQFNEDHVPLTSTSGTPPNGYHTAIHLVPQGSITNTPGYGQVYSQTVTDINTDEALFWNTGTGNRTVQMTVPIVPVTATNGYTFLPGGLILQWGEASTVASGSTIAFNIPFPSNCFNVSLTLTAPNPVPSLNIAADLLTKPNFTLRINVAGTLNLFWMAIGN